MDQERVGNFIKKLRMKEKFNRKKLIISIIIKTIAILSSIYGIIKTYFGPLSFTYFTTLSNLFISIILLIFLFKDIYCILTKKEIIFKNYLYIIKFLATISITLTFFVYLTILAPTLEGGIINSYLSNDAGSLCVHFITPILSIIDFLFFDYWYKSKNSHSIYAIIPPLLYVLFVVIASSLGLRWGEMYAPYNFLNYHAETGWFGLDLSLIGWETLGIGVFYMLIILSVLFIIIGRLFLWLRNKINNNVKGI